MSIIGAKATSTMECVTLPQHDGERSRRPAVLVRLKRHIAQTLTKNKLRNQTRSTITAALSRLKLHIAHTLYVLECIICISVCIYCNT